MYALLISAVDAAGQLEVRVSDTFTGEPLPGANIAWRTVDATAPRYLPTDRNGLAVLPVDQQAAEDGIVLHLSFTGHVTLIDTVRSLAPLSYVMRPDVLALREHVVTAQYTSVPVERAVHKVRVITAGQIERMAANDLGDALRQETGIRLSQDNILGTSMSMQGLGGENVKILIDGVPVIGRLNGSIDLAQIDLNGIERIEVVEGPLSVSYGTNALAGTINLITRTHGSRPASLKASSYLEHIGRWELAAEGSASWGRHDLVIDLARDLFAGWDPDQKGLPDLGPGVADSSRHQQWKPREQYAARLNYHWTDDLWRFGARSEFSDDLITDRGSPRPPYGETAFDACYHTVRIDNALTADRRWDGGGKLSLLAAHDRYRRIRNTWLRDLTTLDEQLVTTPGMQDTTRFTLTNVRAVYGKAPSNTRYAWELGSDLNVETGSGDRIGDGGAEDIGDHAVFASMEWRPVDHITLRPGVRYAYNTRYEAPAIPSLNARWQIDSSLTARASYAQGFRAPSLKELYFLFVDINHDIVGNTDLKAERSQNWSASLAWTRERRQGSVRAEVSGFFNHVEDLIALAQVADTRYTYINVGDYRTTGGTVGLGWTAGGWSTSAGYSLTGRSDDLAQQQSAGYLWSNEWRASVTHDWPRSGFSAQIYWKYQGALSDYVIMDDGTVGRRTIDAVRSADLSAGKTWWGRRLRTTLGCKNLFDVQNVNTNSTSVGVHGGGEGSIPMMTGRTFFLKLELELTRRDT